MWWIIALSFFLLRLLGRYWASGLTLQRVLELQEQASITDHVIAGLQARNNLGPAVMAFAQGDLAACKLVRAGLQINIGHILSVAQNGGIRHQKRLGNNAGADFDIHVHGAFEAFAGIGSFDAGLQSTSGGVERRSEVLNFAAYLSRIRLVFDSH